MPFTTKRSQDMMGKTTAKKSKQVHGEPSSALAPPSDDAVRMDVEHGAPLSVTR